jgi:hypothetical protein
MIINILFDKILSNLIVCTVYFIIALFWLYCFNNLEVQIQLLFFYFPYGILVLSFLFFGNKVILGLLLAKICINFFLLNYDFVLPFKDYFVISLIQLVSVPISLFALEKFNYTVGTGKNYKLDKTNIYHVLLICFLSAILNFILNIFYGLFFISQVNFLLFGVGCLFGSVVLIVLIKLLVNIPYMLKNI